MFAQAYMDLNVRERLFTLITHSLTYLEKPKFENFLIFLVYIVLIKTNAPYD